MFIIPDEMLMTQIGYLMPGEELMEWEVNMKSDMTLICKRIEDAIVDYVYPFMGKYSDFNNFAEAISNKDYYSRLDYFILMAIIYYQNGNRLKSIECLDARFKNIQYTSKEYERFNESFRKLLQ